MIRFALRWAGGILKAIPWQAYAALGACLALWLLWSAHTSAVSQARSAGDKTGYTRATTEFVAAQVEAEKLAREYVAAVVTKQTEISNEASDDHETQLAALRSRYDALRLRYASDRRSPGSIDLPAAAEAPGKPDVCADSDRLLGLAQAADENTLKLINLQNAARALGLAD